MNSALMVPFEPSRQVIVSASVSAGYPHRPRHPTVTRVRNEDGQDHAVTDYVHRTGGHPTRCPDDRP